MAPQPLPQQLERAVARGAQRAPFGVGHEVGLERGRALVAFGGVARERLEGHGLELGRDAGRHPRGGRDPPGRRLAQHLGVIAAGDRRSQGEERVQQPAQGVDVGPLVHALELAARLLGRHVARRAEDRALLGQEGCAARARRALGPGAGDARLLSAVAQLGEAPVHDQHLAELAHHDVARLEVAVDHAAAVREPDRVAHLAEHVEQLGERARRRAGAELVEQLLERAAAHALHGEERPPVGRQPDLVHRANVGVLELALDLRLLHEPQQELGAAGRVRLEELDHQLAPQLDVARGHDHAHAAAGDLLAQLVAPRQQLGRAWPRRGGIRPERAGLAGGQARERRGRHHGRRVDERAGDVRRPPALGRGQGPRPLRVARHARDRSGASGRLPTPAGRGSQRSHGRAKLRRRA